MNNIIKLLGVKFTSDMNWNENTGYIMKKAYSRLVMVRRLKLIGANQGELLDIYVKQIINVIEHEAVVLHSGLPEINSMNIEILQKACLEIILGQRYVSSSTARQTRWSSPIDDRPSHK